MGCSLTWHTAKRALGSSTKTSRITLLFSILYTALLEEDRKSSDPIAVVEVKDMYKACMNVGELAGLKYKF